MLEQGQYYGHSVLYNQWRKICIIGGNRFLWEQHIFLKLILPNQYRPKYGALNLFQYIDGASVRFGSCFFSLKQVLFIAVHLLMGIAHKSRYTLHKRYLCCCLADIFKDVKSNCRMLNQAITSEQETLAVLLNPCNKPKHIGRNLDFALKPISMVIFL